MVHIYQIQNPDVMHKRRREIIIAEINILRKFEGRSLIEEREERLMSKMHKLWFGPKPQEKKKAGFVNQS